MIDCIVIVYYNRQVKDRFTNMSHVQWTLDLKDGIDLYAPLGRIKIIEDEGYVEDKCTHIRWLF